MDYVLAGYDQPQTGWCDFSISLVLRWQQA